MKDESPFSAPSYALSSCTLNGLTNANSAREISEHLTKIDPWHALGYASERLLQYFLRHDPALKRYSVVKKDHLCGVVCIRYPWLRGPYLEMLGIFESYQKTGIGSEILQWAEKQSRIESKNLWALVSEFNQHAIRFYEQKGFVCIAPLRDLIKPGANELLYRKAF